MSRLYGEFARSVASPIPSRNRCCGWTSALFWAPQDSRDRAGESVDAINKEIKRFAKTGPTEKELDEAKSYLKGSQMLAPIPPRSWPPACCSIRGQSAHRLHREAISCRCRHPRPGQSRSRSGCGDRASDRGRWTRAQAAAQPASSPASGGLARRMTRRHLVPGRVLWIGKRRDRQRQNLELARIANRYRLPDAF